MPVDFSKYGGKGTTSSTKSKTKISADLSKYQTVADTNPNARPVRPTRILPETPSYDVTQSPLLQAAHQIDSIPTGKGLVSGRGAVEMDEAPRNINEELALKAKRIPVIGSILRGLDKFATNPTVDKGADIARSFYIPGGGMANLMGLTGAAENAVSRVLPKLGNSIAGRIGQKAISEAIVGAPLGAGQEQMVNPNATIKDLAKGAAYGAALGGGLGGLGKGVGEAIQYGKGTANGLAQNALRNVEKNKRTVNSPFLQGAENNPVATGYTKNVGKTFGNSPKERIIADFSHETPKPQLATAPILKAVEEPTPIPNERSNFVNQRENGNFSSEFNAEQAKRDLTYEPLANKEVSDRVDQRFNKESIDSIEADFLSNHELSADHTMIGYKLMKKLDQAGIGATDPELRKTLITKAVNVAEKLAADLTRAGQASQAAVVLKRLSPEGQFLNFVREATKNGKPIKPKDAAQFMEQAKIRQENISSGPETANFYDLLDRIKAGEKVSADEIRSSAETMLAEAKQNAKPEKPVKEVKPRVRDKVLSYLEKEAEAAKKELAIKNNLGFARKAGTPDIVLWSKVMAHELAKKTINIADFTELLVKQAGEQIRPHAKAIYEQSKRLIGRADKRIGPDKVKILEKFIEEGKFTPADEKVLRGIAADIDKLKGAKGLAADMKMQQILNKYQKTSPYGMLQTLRYMMMLMNESTQSLNAISGPIMMLTKQMWDIAFTPIDIALSKVLPNWERTTTFKQGPGLFDNVFTPMVDWFKGLKTGGEAGWKGVDPEGITSQHDIRGRAFKDKVTSWNLGLGERTLGMVAKAPDYATFNATRNMELRKIAYLDAINSGVKGKEAQRAHMQKFLADPPQQAIEQAARQGKKTTFQFNEGVAGKVARWGAKPLSPAVPFIKTPMNIGIAGMEHTPAGILKGLYEIALLARGSENISKREILQTLTSSAGGTVVLGGLGYILANLGIITGDSTTKEKDVQALKDFTGEGKFKFNTTAFNRMFDVLFDGDMNKIKEASNYQPGDKQLDYNRLQPLAMPVAMGATFQQDKGKPMGERLTDTAKSTGSSLFGMTALKGLQDIASAPVGAQGSDKTFAFFNNIAESYAKSFSPSAFAAEARRQDSSQRDVSFNKGFKEDVGSYYKSRIPESFRGLGLGTSKDLPEKITNLGDVKQNIDPYLNTLKSEKSQFNQAAKIISDVIKKTGDESLAPTAMETTVKGTKKGEKEQKTIKIDPKRYDKLQRDVGTEITQKIIALSPDRRTAKYIEKIYSDTRTKYRDKLKKELGLK